MRLKEVRIKRFGCLEDFAAELKPGLNIIRGPNESGKSTLHQALLMALVTQPNQNKTTGLWRNWSSEQWYRLELDFEDQQGDSYRITKDFESRFQELKMPGGASAKNRGSISAALEKVLGTSSMLVLRSTLCVEQDALAAIADGSGEIAQSLETIVTGGEEGSYTEKATRQLDRKIKDHQRGTKRHATRPGPLAWAQREKERLAALVARNKEQVKSQASEEEALDKAVARSAEIDEVLVPKQTTWQQVTRRKELLADLTQSSQIEKALEAKVEQIQEAQEQIEEAVRTIGTFGSVARLSDTQVRKASDLASRIETLEEGYVKYQQSMAAYEQEMAVRKEKIVSYREEHAAYETALEAFEQEEAGYREAMEAYQSAVAEHESELAAYQDAWAPYEVALEAQQQEMDAYETEREAYEQALPVYEEKLAAYEKAAALSAADGQGKGVLVGRGWLALTGLGGIVAVAGLLLWQLANNSIAGMVMLGLGILMLLGGLWWRSRAGRANEAPTERVAESATLERPQPPTPPEPPVLSEDLQKSGIEKPQPLALEQPVKPEGERPQPLAPLPPPPIKPTFDEEGLETTRTELETILQAADCESIDALNEQYAQLVILRNQEEKARSRLGGLLGDSTAEELEEQRRNASRSRRDAEEILEEPDLQRVATITPVSVNHLDRKIKTLERELAELQEKQKRLQIRLEEQPVSHEDLLRAEEQLAAAEQAYQREQERGKVYALAQEMLTEARTRTLEHAQARLGPQTVGYLETLTHGRYQKVQIDSDLNIELRDPADSKRRILPDRLSRGAQDQLYMAARLALVDLLFPNTRPPVLLDDPFVHFDPQRLAAAIEMCEELAAERQILLFTCSDNYNEVGHHIVMPLLGQLEG